MIFLIVCSLTKTVCRNSDETRLINRIWKLPKLKSPAKRTIASQSQKLIREK